MLPGKKYSADDVLRTVVRRRWWLVLPAVLGLTAGVAASSRLPEKYRSETLILVVPPRIPQEIMPRNPETVADRLNTINEVILSRSRLERIIRDLNLYGQQRAESVMEDLVVRMRNGDQSIDRREGIVSRQLRERHGEDCTDGHRPSGVPLHR